MVGRTDACARLRARCGIFVASRNDLQRLAVPMQIDEYRKLAETEDRMWYFRALHRRLDEALAGRIPGEARRVLDAGCGTGGFIRHASARHPSWRWSGIDFSPLACQLARERSAGAEIREASIEALPYADGTFDGLVSADVLCQVADFRPALAEFARVLGPGGVAVINVPAYRWLWSYHDDAVQSKHRFTRDELVSALRAAGFGIAFATYANFPVLPLVVARRKLFPPGPGASDVGMMPWPVEQGLAALARIEHGWLSRGWASPAGSSVFVVATRPGLR